MHVMNNPFQSWYQRLYVLMDIEIGVLSQIHSKLHNITFVIPKVHMILRSSIC